jgi:hypothetical protein
MSYWHLAVGFFQWPSQTLDLLLLKGFFAIPMHQKFSGAVLQNSVSPSMGLTFFWISWGIP